MTRFDLEREAKAFASKLSVLLNKTVCNGVRVQAVLRPGNSGIVHVGYKLTRRDWDSPQAIPLCIDGRAATVYLALSYRLASDHEGAYLMVASSVLGLTLDAEQTQELVHFDYERDKPDGYPEAHIQVVADSPEWAALRGRPGVKALGRMHLPVGGRRFRPTLEDVIEFVVREGLAEGRSGWRDVVERSRDDYAENQLRAAVRRYPEVARDVLKRIDTEAQAPPPP